MKDKKRRNLLIIVLIAALLFIAFFPFRGNNSSLLRTCKFDEAKGTYSKCFWLWDDASDSPSVYF